MRYLHTMVRVSDLDASLDFYCNKLGLVEASRVDNPAGRFTLVFLCAPGDEAGARQTKAPMVELTFNWDVEDYQGGRNFGHLAYAVDGISIELLQAGERKAPAEPWASMQNTGAW